MVLERGFLGALSCLRSAGGAGKRFCSIINVYSGSGTLETCYKLVGKCKLLNIRNGNI